MNKYTLFFIVSAAFIVTIEAMEFKDLDKKGRERYSALMARFNTNQDQWAAQLLNEQKETTVSVGCEPLSDYKDIEKLDEKGDDSNNKEEVCEYRDAFTLRVPEEDRIQGAVPSLKFLATKAYCLSGKNPIPNIPNDFNVFIAYYRAAQTANQKIPKGFIYQGATPKVLNCNFKSETKPDISPLMVALHAGNVYDVNALLNDEGVDPNIADGNDGVTPLIVAAHEGMDYFVDRLLENPKIDVTKKDDFGRDALYYASLEGHSAIAQKLIRHGAPTTTKDVANNTIYKIASDNATLFSLLEATSNVVAGDVQARLMAKSYKKPNSDIEFIVKQ